MIGGDDSFYEEFAYEYEAKDPIKVYAGSALHMTFEMPDSAFVDVKEGDIIAVTYGERTLKFRVVDVREHAAKADAASMYEIITD